MPEIQLGTQIISYKVRKSKRAKYVQLRMDFRKGLELVIPYGQKVDDPDSFIREKQDWILRHYTEYLQTQEREKTRNEKYESGAEWWFMGESVRLDIQRKQEGTRSSIQLNEQILLVSLAKDVPEDKEELMTRELLEAWYRMQAKGYIPFRTAELAQKFGFEYKRVTIKNQKTRWGSCSTKNNLNFNLRLMMAVSPAIDYVIIHELCHLRHMNHSKDFWNLVEQYCADYKRWKRWLKENDSRLRF